MKPISAAKLLYGMLEKIAAARPPWQDASSREIVPACSYIPVSLPRNHAGLPPRFAAGFISGKSVPARRVFQLEQVWVSGQGVVFRDLRIFRPSLPWAEALKEQQKGQLLLKQWWPRKPMLQGPVALVYDEWSAQNYYHWMIEALPRVLLAQAAAPGCTVLVPDGAPVFIQRTLSLMGVSKTLPLANTQFAAVGVANLLLPELVYYEVAEATDVHPIPTPAELIQEVRHRLLRHLPQPVAPVRRIYASRLRQRTRRLANEAALLPVLETLGFEVVYFETMDYNQQVALMQQTCIFAGVHGANMVNLLFLPAGAQVVELMNEQHVNDAYYLLAASLGMPYRVVPCAMATAPGAGATSVDFNDADLVVDVQVAAETLRAAVEDEAAHSYLSHRRK